MELRLGDLLIERGVLSAEQVQEILVAQGERAQPFGMLAEQMFGVDPAAIETAWANQYARITRTIDPLMEVFEASALDIISRRQAWQFRVLPIRFATPELMMATTPEHLPRALRFASHVIRYPVYYVMAEPEALGRALCKHYALPGLSPNSLIDDGLDRLLNLVSGRAA